MKRSQIVEQLAIKIAAKKDIEAEIADLTSALNLHDNGSEVHGDFVIKWSTGVRFNEELARTVLTKTEQKQAVKEVIDSAKVKALFGAKYAKCQKANSAPTIKIELVEVGE